MDDNTYDRNYTDDKTGGSGVTTINNVHHHHHFNILYVFFFSHDTNEIEISHRQILVSLQIIPFGRSFIEASVVERRRRRRRVVDGSVVRVE